jgi:transposase
MEACEWFNPSTKSLQDFISTRERFTDLKTPDKYSNVLSSLKHSITGFGFNLNMFPKYSSDGNKLICSHKYQINFNDEQHEILKGYFHESKKVYDLCVDVWNEYKECTHNWQIFKDVLFHFLYRNEQTKELSLKEIKLLIINELKKKQKEYDLENEKNKEKIDKLKSERNEKFKKEMEEYKKNEKVNKKATIKVNLIKPKKEKIKLEKIENPPKPKGNVIKKPAPDDTLKSEIKEFCTNLSNARNQAFENKKYNFETKKFNDDAYEMKHKNISQTQTISVSERNISKDGIFINTLKKIDCKNWKHITEKYPLNKECKLQYDYVLNKYYLFVVFDGKEVITKNRNEVVALDPGEKIFNYFYSKEMQGKLGDEMRVKIIGWQKMIKKYQSAIDKKKNRKDKKLKNKKALKNKIRKLYLKIKGYVNEIHKKSAKFLCENYENILLPEFKTQEILSNKKIKLENERIKQINDKVKAKIEIKKLKRNIRLSKEVKFVLSMQSHYGFKRYLKATAKRYKTNVHDVDEKFTSQCCTKCGMLSKNYDNKRVKTCTNCKLKIDRDMNGSRNIYLKCISSLSGLTTRLANLQRHLIVCPPSNILIQNDTKLHNFILKHTI